MMHRTLIKYIFFIKLTRNKKKQTKQSNKYLVKGSANVLHLYVVNFGHTFSIGLMYLYKVI